MHIVVAGKGVERAMKTKYRSKKSLTPVNTAIKKFFEAVRKYSEVNLDAEDISIHNALGRVIATDLRSDIDIPSFHRAAMDGYAVRSLDTKQASIRNPILFDIKGNLNAGQANRYRIQSGQTVEIATGAKLPYGADAVIKVEDVHIIAGKRLRITNPVSKNNNVSVRGEDIKFGALLFQKGTWLSPSAVGLIASIGRNRIKVVRKPNVAVLSTGDEIAEPGSKLGKNSIFDSNRYMISAMVKECGGESIDMGICPDDERLILNKLTKSLKYDIITASGGSSVGKKDYLPKLIDRIGKPGIIVQGVAMKPGSPTGLGLINRKPLVICPGFPVSSFAAFQTFVRPLIFLMLNTRGPPVPKIVATMSSDVNTKKGVRTLIRIKISKDGNHQYLAIPISVADSRLLSTLTNADGFLTVDDKTGLTKGEKVEVILTRSIS